MERTQLKFNAKVKPIKPINEEFELVKVYVAATGCNRNYTYISKESMQENLNSLNYVPVVGHVIKATDEEGNVHTYMGGHDRELDLENWEYIDLTQPYGVVVNDTFEFENVEEYGKTVEYLTAHAILWIGRYEELKDCIYSEDFYFNQSMEINVKNYRPYEEDSNYTELLDWQFSALCLLGKADENSTTGHTDSEEHTEPCFISASVLPIEYSKSEFAKEFNELKEKIQFCLSKQSPTAEVVNKNYETGGNSMAKQKLDDVTKKEFEDEVVDDTQTTEDDTQEDKVTDNTQSAEDNNDTEDNADSGEENTDVEDFSAKYEELKTQYEELAQEYEVYKAEHSYFDSEVEELKAYKENAETEKRQDGEDSLFAKYDKKLDKCSKYEDLKKNAKDYTLEQLNKECLALVGEFAMSEVDNKPTDTTIKFSVESKTSMNTDPYQGLKEKYLG